MAKIPLKNIDFDSDIIFSGKRSQSYYIGWDTIGTSETVNFTITPFGGVAFVVPFTTEVADNLTVRTVKLVNVFNQNADFISAGMTAYQEGTPGEWNPFHPAVYDYQLFIKSQPGVSFTVVDDNPVLVNRAPGNDQSAILGASGRVRNLSPGETDKEAVNVSQLKSLVGSTVAQVGSTTQWNPNTNTPTLTDGTGVEGQFYASHADGTFNGTYYRKADRIVYSGGKWVNDHNFNLNGSRSQATYFGLNAAGPFTDTFVVTPAGGTAINIPVVASSSDGGLTLLEIIEALNNSSELKALGFYSYKTGAADEYSVHYPALYNHGYLKGPKGVTFTLVTSASINRDVGSDLPATVGQAQKVTNIATGVNPNDGVNVDQLNAKVTGATGSFTTVDGKTVTVVGGLITAITL